MVLYICYSSHFLFMVVLVPLRKKRGFFCFVFNWQRSQYISLKYSQKRQQTILMLNTNFSVTSNTTMNQAADMLQYFTSKAAAFHQHCAQVNSIYFNAVCKTGNSSWKWFLGSPPPPMDETGIRKLKQGKTGWGYIVSNLHQVNRIESFNLLVLLIAQHHPAHLFIEVWHEVFSLVE